MAYKQFHICLLIIINLLMGSCKKIEVKEIEPHVIVESIPEKDRFIFDTGDCLLYSCSDGSVDTLRVRGTNFYTHSYSEKDWLGILWHYEIDNGEINLEITDVNWLKILYYACHDSMDCSTCLNIKTTHYPDEFPFTVVFFGCNGDGGLIIGSSEAVSELYLGGRYYTNVYAWTENHSTSEGFRMYWSLRYGIIRFEGETGDTIYTWDLQLDAGE